MATTTVNLKSSQTREWRKVADHLTRGEQVIVDHYNRPMALISPLPHYKDKPLALNVEQIRRLLGASLQPMPEISPSKEQNGSWHYAKAEVLRHKALFATLEADIGEGFADSTDDLSPFQQTWVIETAARHLREVQNYVRSFAWPAPTVDCGEVNKINARLADYEAALYFIEVLTNPLVDQGGTA